MPQKMLWEILVPCFMNDEIIQIAHHKKWDVEVLAIAGGLTVNKPGPHDHCWICGSKTHTFTDHMAAELAEIDRQNGFWD